MSAARKPTYDKSTAGRLLDRIARGETIVKACGAEKVSWRTFAAWKAIPEFARLLVQAESAQADLLDELRVRVAAQITQENATARKAELASIESRMASLDPGRYGRAATRTAEDDDNLEAVGVTTQVHIFLPDNSRDPELIASLGGPSIEEREAYDRRRREFVEGRDKQLRHWVASGRMTEDAALLARSQWIGPDDEPWVPPSRPQPPQRALEYRPSASNGTESTTLMHGPNALFQLPGKVYRADARGEIRDVDESDRDELLRLGCRPRRQEGMRG
jgi:hypothetical protein